MRKLFTFLLVLIILTGCSKNPTNNNNNDNPAPSGKIIFSASTESMGEKRIYSLDATAGEVDTVVSGVNVSELSVSPGRTKIAYATWGDIYTVNYDGTGIVQITSTSDEEKSPAFSSSGDKIAFLRADSPSGSVYSIVIYDISTGDEQVLISGRNIVSGLEWSYDDSRIGYYSSGVQRLFHTVRLSNGVEETILGFPNLASDFAFSPVGLFGYVGTSYGLLFADVASDTFASITEFDGACNGIDFSPNGNIVALVHTRQDGGYFYSDIYTLDAGATNIHSLTSNFRVNSNILYTSLEFSPSDNDKIAYIKGVSSGGTYSYSICCMDISTAEETVLNTGFFRYYGFEW